MATEIAILPLGKGYTPDDANSEGGQIWKDTLDTLAQQDGMQGNYWGREVENPEILRLFVNWDSVDHHIKFTKTEAYGPFIERANMMCDMKNAQLYHTHYTPHPPTSALSDVSAGATEILTIYFPEDYSDSDKNKFEEDLKKLFAAIEDNSKDYKGSAGGWVVEKIAIPDSNDKGTVYAAAIGWTSVEAHMLFRETQPFKDNIHYLRNAKDLKKMTVSHASLKETSGGAGGVGDTSEEAANEEGAGALNPHAGGRQSVKTAADGTTTKNDGGAANSNKKERAGR